MGWQCSSWWWEGNNFIQVYWKKWKEKKRLLFTYIHIQWAKTNCTAGSTLRGSNFKSVGRIERKRKDFYSPIYTYSELKPTVLLAALWEEATSFKSVGRSERKRKDLFAWQYSSWWWEGNNFIQVYWERKTKDFCCFPLRVLPAVQLVLAHCMCIEQKRTQEPLAYVGSVRTLVGALLCTWGYLCLP